MSRARNSVARSSGLNEGLVVGSGVDAVGCGESDPLEYGLASNIFRNGAGVGNNVGP